MSRSKSGFTIVEWCVLVIAIAAVVACSTQGGAVGRTQVYSAMDAMQLRTHYTWLEVYRKSHHGGLPRVGGYKFVMSTWTSKVFDHTPENFDMFFSPGARDGDADYLATRKVLLQGEEPWPDLAATTSLDTHYVGRAEKFLRTASMDPAQALMATDNEGRWIFADGTVNVLLHGGAVRTYSHQDLEQRFAIAPLGSCEPIVTHGADSPIPECTKLAN